MIDRIVADPKWMEDYMTFEDELEAARRNAERRGYQRGIERGGTDMVVRLVRGGVLSVEDAVAGSGIDAESILAGLGGPDQGRKA